MGVVASSARDVQECVSGQGAFMLGKEFSIAPSGNVPLLINQSEMAHSNQPALPTVWFRDAFALLETDVGSSIVITFI